eukprot:3296398-Rhodomonas_salina.2
MSIGPGSHATEVRWLSCPVTCHARTDVNPGSRLYESYDWSGWYCFQRKAGEKEGGKERGWKREPESERQREKAKQREKMRETRTLGASTEPSSSRTLVRSREGSLHGASLSCQYASMHRQYLSHAITSPFLCLYALSVCSFARLSRCVRCQHALSPCCFTRKYLVPACIVSM